MILTKKAKEDFLKWYSHNPTNLEEVEFDFNMENELLKTTYIIEFFDSIGVYICIEPSIPIGYDKPDYFLFRVDNVTNRNKFNTRQQATEQAIIKANEIYNERKQV